MRAATACVLVALSGAWLAGRQQTPSVFTARTDLIQVDVSVLDGRRQPVRGLTAADFTVLEDGRPRHIEAFAEVDLPSRQVIGEAAWMSDVPADVVSNRAIAQEGRLVVILMDRTIPVGTPTVKARDIATAAVNALGVGDMAALVSTSGGVPQNFTSDRTRLLRAINQRDWSTGISPEAQEIEDKVLTQIPGVFTSLTDGRCLCGLCVLHTITRVAEALQDVPRRRKSLFFIGSDLVVQAGPQAYQAELGCGQKLVDARAKMFAALDRSGVTIHSIDPSGLNVVGPTGRASSLARARDVIGANARAVEDVLKSQTNLTLLPDYTGGRTVTNTNAPQSRVPEIFSESQSYYLLGFKPSDGNSARPIRSIDVKVNRKDIDVRARREFSLAPTVNATAAPSTPASSAALSGLLPDGQMPLAAHLSVFSTPGAARPTLAVAVSIDAFGPLATSAARDTPLELVVAAFDPTGQPRASARQQIELSWPPAGPDAPAHVEALTRLPLDPGEYEVRVAVENTASRQVSSVFSYVTVPPFASVPLSLSSIVVEAPRTTTSVPRDALQGLLPLSPTTSRTFRRSEPASAFVRVYQGTGRDDAVSPVAMRIQILDSHDRVVRTEIMSLGASAFDAGRTADCRLTLPVALLAPGEYLLRLEAGMGERVAGRAMRFSVQ